MALNIDTQDLDNYPGVTKRVTMDMNSVVPVGYYGDEKMVMSASTSTYSDNTARTAIQDLYITDFKAGWCKSSGFAGSAGKFTVDASHYKLMVMIDATVSGSDGQGYYEILLDPSDSPASGEAVAADIETKIRTLSDNLETADQGFVLAYKNAKVEYTNGKFWIISGSVSRYYTGSYRSSVKVAAADTHNVSENLGFNLSMDSQVVASNIVKETSLGTNYTTDTATLTLTSSVSAQAGDCLMIKDSTNVDYFTALSGTSGVTIKVATQLANSYIGIANSYTVASGTKIQVLREQDPEADPNMYYTDMDALARFGIRTMISQIDYSS